MRIKRMLLRTVALAIVVMLTALYPVTAAARENSSGSAAETGDSGYNPFVDGSESGAADPEAVRENPFHDVFETDPYHEAVLYCYKNGIVNGMSATRFAPGETLTRAMFVTLLGRVADNIGLKTSGYTSSFSDVQKNSWYDTYVGWAAANDIVNGMSAKRFAPEEPVTREQAAVIAVRFADEYNIKLDNSLTFELTDRDAVSDWARASMNKAIAAGLAVGADEGLLRPQDNATRAETVTMLHVLCCLYIGETRVYTLYGETVKADSRLTANEYIKENFQTNGSLKSYQDDQTVSLQGIDVSAHQDKIDWAKVRAAGIDFAMLRVGGRGYGVETGGKIFADEKFEENIKGALANDIKVGVYFFSQAISVAEAVEEAEYTLAKIEGYDVRFPVVYDWENIANARARTDNLSKKTLTECAVAFCDTVAAAGYKPMVYFNTHIGLALYDLGGLSAYDFWLAEYRDVPEFVYNFQIWQYTDKGKVDGIPWNTDMNISFVDYSLW